VDLRETYPHVFCLVTHYCIIIIIIIVVIIIIIIIIIIACRALGLVTSYGPINCQEGFGG
jgi:hypothetical protein